MSKHTPGEWRAIPICGTEWNVHGPASPHPSSDGFIEPDARLMAAAPELLEACEAALVALNTAVNFKVTITNGLPIKSSYDIASLLDKAIRKAKGESA